LILERLKDQARKQGLRYLVIGGLNTLFGYGVTVGLYYALTPAWHLLAVATLANIIAITFSFVTYKLIIFKGRGHWLSEYLRCYVVYGFMALFNIAGLWTLVDLLGVPAWLAQGLVMGLAVAGSFVGHELFTFKTKQAPAKEPGR